MKGEQELEKPRGGQSKQTEERSRTVVSNGHHDINNGTHSPNYVPTKYKGEGWRKDEEVCGEPVHIGLLGNTIRQLVTLT